MLAGTLILIAALIQSAPPQRTAAVSGSDPVEVVGRVELSPAAADASARFAVAQEARWELERRGGEVVATVRPVWLPELYADQVLARWLRETPVERAFTIVDSERREHDHGDYRSYETRLSVVQDDAAVGRMLADLRRGIARGERRFSWLAGGTAGLWALLALAYGWLDRLTRGYMPWRLRLVCVGMGVVAPGIALLLV